MDSGPSSPRRALVIPATSHQGAIQETTESPGNRVGDAHASLTMATDWLAVGWSFALAVRLGEDGPVTQARVAVQLVCGLPFRE